MSEATIDTRAMLDEIEADRQRDGFSRAELARAADISDSTYTRLLQQPDRQPHPRTLRKLRQGLDRLAHRAGQRGAAE